VAVTLSERHQCDLEQESAIARDVIAERGYRTVADRAELLALGFGEYQARAPALLVPLHGVDGANGRYAIKPDQPRIEHRPDKPDRHIKYEYSAGSPHMLDVPPRCTEMLFDASVDLFFTEREVEARRALQRGLAKGVADLRLPLRAGFDTADSAAGRRCGAHSRPERPTTLAYP
jgi:hypothetical protein